MTPSEAMGQKVGEDAKAEIRKSMREMRKILALGMMRASFAEVHAAISSPELSAEDFRFAVPAGAVLRDSLFSGDMVPRSAPRRDEGWGDTIYIGVPVALVAALLIYVAALRVCMRVRQKKRAEEAHRGVEARHHAPNGEPPAA